MIGFYVLLQNKVEGAEKKYDELKQQLEELHQQQLELQPRCVELKTEAQRRNNLLMPSKVRVLYKRSF